MSTPSRGGGSSSSAAVVRFEGVLKKQEPKGAPGSQTLAWVPRYVILNNNTLAFYLIKHTTIVERDVYPEVVTTGDPVGLYDLAYTECGPSANDKSGLCFELVVGVHKDASGNPTTGGVVQLQAASKDECESWLTAIKRSKARSVVSSSSSGGTPAGGGGGGGQQQQQSSYSHDNTAAASATPLRPRNLGNGGDFNNGVSTSSPSLSAIAAARGGGGASTAGTTGGVPSNDSLDDPRAINQLRVQLREAQLRHEATLEANKKALAAVGTKHYQEKQALLEKIAMLEGRLGEAGVDGTLADLETQLAHARGEVSSERARTHDALQRLEVANGRLQSIGADLEGTRAILAVERKRTAELQDQLDSAMRRITELQVENEKLRGVVSAGGGGGGGGGRDGSFSASMGMRGSGNFSDSSAAGGGGGGVFQDMVITELRSKIASLEAALNTSEQRAQNAISDHQRLRSSSASGEARLQAELAELQERYKAATAAANAANREVEELRGNWDEKEEKAKQSIREADRRQREFGMLQSSLESQLDQERVRVTDLRDQLQKLERELTDAKRVSEQYRQEVHSLRSEQSEVSNDLKEERNRNIERLRIAETQRLEVDAERQQLLQQVQIDTAAIEQLQADLSRALRAQEEAQDLLQDQRLVNKALRSRLDEMADEISEGRDMIGDAEKRVAAAVINAQHEVRVERSRVEEAEVTIADLSRNMQHKDQRISELEKSLNDRRAQQEAMTQHFDQVVEGLRADTSAAVARATAAELRAANAEHELEQLLSTRATSDRIAGQAAKQIRDMKADMEEAREELQRVQMTQRDLQKRYDMSTALVEQYKRTNDRQAREIEELKRAEASNIGIAVAAGARGSSNGLPFGSSRSAIVGASSGVVDEPLLGSLQTQLGESQRRYSELSRASEMLAQEKSRELSLLQEQNNQLQREHTAILNQHAALKRENADLREALERNEQLSQHLRSQLESKNIQLDDKSRQLVEAAVKYQSGRGSQLPPEFSSLEREISTLKSERQRLLQQLEAQQNLVLAKDQAILEERRISSEIMRAEQVQRQLVEEENMRLRGGNGSSSAVSGAPDLEKSRLEQHVQYLETQLRVRDDNHRNEMAILQNSLQEEQQSRTRMENLLRASGDSQQQFAMILRERDELKEEKLALKRTLVSKQTGYEGQIRELQTMNAELTVENTQLRNQLRGFRGTGNGV